MKKTRIIFSILSIISYICTVAQALVIDSTFGENGRLFSAWGRLIKSSQIHFQPNLKILLDGVITQGGDARHYVTRVSSEGRIDSSFGPSGTLDSRQINRNSFHPSGIVILSDSEIVIGGSANNLYKNSINLAKIKSDGTLNTHFGDSGLVVKNFPEASGAGGYYPPLIVRDFVGILIVSQAKLEPENKVLVHRYSLGGQVDLTYGKGGICHINDTALRFLPEVACIYPDGSLIIGSGRGLDRTSFILMRISAEGIVDRSFGENGIATVKMGPCSLKKVLIQPDGKILCMGSVGENTWYFGACRLSKDGQLDRTYGDNGMVKVGVAPVNYVPVGLGDYFARVASATLDPEGGAVIAGVATIDAKNSLMIVRLDEDGVPDRSFGTGGCFLYNFPDGVFTPNSIAFQDNIRLLVAGKFGPQDWKSDSVLLTRFILNRNALAISNTLVIQVAPNPALGDLIVEVLSAVNKNLQVFLIDRHGRTVISSEIVQRRTIFNIEHLVSGMYFLRVWGGGQVNVKKVLINTSR